MGVDLPSGWVEAVQQYSCQPSSPVGGSGGGEGSPRIAAVRLSVHRGWRRVSQISLLQRWFLLADGADCLRKKSGRCSSVESTRRPNGKSASGVEILIHCVLGFRLSSLL